MFNKDNTTWKEGKYSLFLGESPALYDSINTPYPKLFELYKKQKAADWSEDEINLEQSRVDMLTCPSEMRDVMVKNLALQWELDSVASRSIAPLFAPFITNSELWAVWLKVSEIEVLHALTYSEIVRQCIPDPQEVFKEVMNNNEILGRAEPVSQAFYKLQVVGAQYSLGQATSYPVYDTIMNAVTALYCLERLQFPASFAATFAVVEQGPYQGIGKLVQKIMQDEWFIHAEVDKTVIQIELGTERGKDWLLRCEEQVKEILTTVLAAEYKWSNYLFSEGRKVVGLNENIMNEWIDYNAQEVYDVLGIEPVRRVKKNPIKFMDNWLDLNKNQNAQQEADSANYALNIIVDDVGEDIIPYDF